jgi:D-serine deaminase-like pyridoxal phosphate-dependent protein
MHHVPGFTDLQVGSYLFMDMQYLAIGGENSEVYSDFVPSLTVLTTILNNRFPGRLTTDAGAKALTLNTPAAGVIGEPGMEYNAGSDEFGGIRFRDESLFIPALNWFWSGRSRAISQRPRRD